MDDRERIADAIRKARQDRGYSAAYVAKKLFMSKRVFYNHENARVRLQVEDAWKLADLYNMTIDELVGRAAVQRTEDEMVAELLRRLIAEKLPQQNKEV